jgi:hypothetical protein
MSMTRFYDPLSPHWLNRDPIRELASPNLYRYGPNAINEIDPLGLQAIIETPEGPMPTQLLPPILNPNSPQAQEFGQNIYNTLMFWGATIYEIGKLPNQIIAQLTQSAANDNETYCQRFYEYLQAEYKKLTTTYTWDAIAIANYNKDAAEYRRDCLPWGYPNVPSIPVPIISR